MAETKKSAITRNPVISRVSELDICSVRSQSSPSRSAVQQALICFLQALTQVGACFYCGGLLFGIFRGCPAEASERPINRSAAKRQLRPSRSAVQQALIWNRKHSKARKHKISGLFLSLTLQSACGSDFSIPAQRSSTARS